MQRFRNILVICDQDGLGEAVMTRVRWLACENGARVTLMDVVETGEGELARRFAGLPGRRGDDLAHDVIANREARLHGFAETFAASDVAARTVLATGTPFLEVIRQVLRAGHDLVIKGARASSFAPFLVGPDMHLLRKCPCPVWILNSRTDTPARRVLAAVDPENDPQDALNRTILEMATSLAEQDDARLDVLAVWRLPEEAFLRHGRVRMQEEELAARLDRIERDSLNRLGRMTAGFARFDDRMRVLHIKGLPQEAIPQHAHDEGIDILVMGTVARTGVAGVFIGNTAETVLSRVNCSVLAVKPEGFVSPVTLDSENGGAA